MNYYPVLWLLLKMLAQQRAMHQLRELAVQAKALGVMTSSEAEREARQEMMEQKLMTNSAATWALQHGATDSHITALSELRALVMEEVTLFRNKSIKEFYTSSR